MHEVKIEIFNAKIVEGSFKCIGDLSWVMAAGFNEQGLS